MSLDEWAKSELKAKKVVPVSLDSRAEMPDEVCLDSQEELGSLDFPDKSVMKAHLDLMASRESRVIAVLTEHLVWMELKDSRVIKDLLVHLV